MKDAVAVAELQWGFAEWLLERSRDALFAVKLGSFWARCGIRRDQNAGGTIPRPSCWAASSGLRGSMEG